MNVRFAALVAKATRDSQCFPTQDFPMLRVTLGAETC